jgi:membrane protease YdiL (CAAX protease family)
MSLPVERNAAAPGPPWGVLASIGWVLLALLLSLFGAALAYGLWQTTQPAAPAAPYHGVVITIGTLASVPVQVGVLAFAAQLRGWTPAGYFGLTMPRRGEVVVAVVAVLALDFAFDAMLYVTGRDIVPPFQIEAYRTASELGWLAPLGLAVVAVAPVGEEIVFRGFLYRGLARRGREMAAIVVNALAWALLHIQYDWLGMAQVFAAGLMLGWFRWASGSVVLVILMHALINLEAMVETAIRAHWLS